MNQRFRIVVAVDFSDCSRAALHRALGLAERLDAVIHVHNVSPVRAARPALSGIALPQPDPNDILAERHRMLRRLVDETGSVRPIEIHSTSGEPAEEVTRLAQALQADMIVAGTHGRSGVERLVLGSVAESIVRASTRPVLVVPAPGRG